MWSSSMLSEGLYSLDYKLAGAVHAQPPRGEALVILRNGRIFGSDPWGGLFDGACEHEAGGGAERVTIRLQLPPDGVLVTGYSAGPAGETIEIVCALAPQGASAQSTVEIAGQPVEVCLRYLGPLPI